MPECSEKTGIRRVFTKLTRLLGYVAAIPAGIYGFVMVLGIGPDGPHHSLAARLIGMFLLAFAVTSFIPHGRLLRSKRVALTAIAVLAAPLAGVLCFLTYIVLTEGAAEAFGSGGAMGFAAYISILLPAPLSLVLACASNKPFAPSSGMNREERGKQIVVSDRKR